MIKRYIAILMLIVIGGVAFSQNKAKPKPQPKPKIIEQPTKPKQQLTTRILFVFDASLSMYGRWQSGAKIEIAQRLLVELVDSIKTFENVEIALRVYGHQKPFPPQDCNDTKLEVPFAKNNTSRIKLKLKQITPKGTTPIAKSLDECANDFPPCDNCRNIIILITDGIEECGGDPCEVSQRLQKKGIFLKPFIIGIGRDFRTSFECVGSYYDASNEENFKNVLRVVISQALNATTCQVNLLDKVGNPTETNVNMTFYDNKTGRVKYNFIHTMNNRGLPDTLVIDPSVTYDIVVHTIPEVTVKGIKLTEGKHTVIPIDVPQGLLSLKLTGTNNNLKQMQAIVRIKDKMETLNLQGFDRIEKYLTGKYDLEILCLPRMIIKDVDVSQSKTTTVEIPQPGIAAIQLPSSGYGSIYVIEDNGRLKWIYNLKENEIQGNLMLQPGNYVVVFRSKSSNDSNYTIERKFTVQSGVSVYVKMN